jgi:predicted ATPase
LFDHIKIEGFRSFKKVELDLAPLSVLIGPNNGGKSNFLDLMSLMAEAGQGQLEKGIDSRGGFRGVASGFRRLGEIVLEFCFQADSLGRFSPYLEVPPIPSFFLGTKQTDIRYRLALTSPVPGTSRIQIEELTERSLPLEPGPEVLMRRGKDGCAFRVVDPTTGLGTQESKALESESELAIFQVRDLYRFPTPYKLLKQFQEWTLYGDIDVGPDALIRLPGLVRSTASYA